MQMFEVAFSRRMCCSRVCSDSRYAGRPSASTDTPTRRPGSCRSSPARTARYPAWGPPKPIGTPKRCVVPTATSAPSEPGERSSVRARRSAATTASPPWSWIAAMTSLGSQTRPAAPGNWMKPPKASGTASGSSKDTTRTSIPSASARWRSSAIVCGRASASTRNTLDALFEARRASSIPSTTAVDSSSIDAPAVAIPVRSVTIVWKVMSASSLPCEISGW